MVSGAGISLKESMDMDDITLMATVIVVNEFNERNPGIKL